MLFSAALFAAANIIRKHVLQKEHSLEFLAARGFFTIILLIPLAFFSDMHLDFRLLGLIYVSSLVATVGYYYQTKAQRHTDISYLAPLQNLAPIFVLLLAFIFLHEQVSGIQFVGLLALVVGSYIVAVNPKTGLLGPLAEFRKDYWLHILVSVLLLAIAAVLDKYVVSMITPVTYLFFGWLFMNINYVLFDWLRYDWSHITEDFRKGWHWLLLCSVFSIVSMLAFYHAIAAPAVLISLAFALRRVSTLIETVLGGTLFHEKFLVQRIFACIIMLIGVVLIVL